MPAATATDAAAAKAAVETANDTIDVFATPELLHHTIQFLVDVTSLSEIRSHRLVSKQFHQALTSDTVWRELCLQRWKEKWGFNKRWRTALHEYHEFKQTQNINDVDSIDVKTYWMHKYQTEEIDATRQCITGVELKELVFDFRFWIGQPTVTDGRIIIRSGLVESAASQLQFKSIDDAETNEWWSAQGVITGHPIRTDDQIEWFLQEESGVIQWGFVPNLWPEGRVRRLESWGWEIKNCNVVMRAIDTECTQNCKGADILTNVEEANNKLWKDLLDDLDNIPLRNNPMVNGFLVTAELPRSYLDQFGL
jgi:hypothetical protein